MHRWWGKIKNDVQHEIHDFINFPRLLCSIFHDLRKLRLKTQYQPKILIDQSTIQKLKETLANIENKNNSLQAALIDGWKKLTQRAKKC